MARAKSKKPSQHSKRGKQAEAQEESKEEAMEEEAEEEVEEKEEEEEWKPEKRQKKEKAPAQKAAKGRKQKVEERKEEEEEKAPAKKAAKSRKQKQEAVEEQEEEEEEEAAEEKEVQPAQKKKRRRPAKQKPAEQELQPNEPPAPAYARENPSRAETVSNHASRPEPPTHSSALLLNFPFHAIIKPIDAPDTADAADTEAQADAATPAAANGSSAFEAVDLSLELVDSAVRCVRSRLDIHLTCDDWSTVTLEALQRRLAAIYTHATNANPSVDTAVLLPNTAPSHTQPPPSAGLSFTYLAESHVELGRTVQHSVVIPPHTAALLCCDFTSLALSTVEIRVNPSKSKKKIAEAKAAKAAKEAEEGETPKKKRRSREEIQAETDKVAARISELVSHTDSIGGIHCPKLLKGYDSLFAERSAAYPPLCVLLRDELERQEDGRKYVVGPLYHIDWLHPSELTMSGTAVLPTMRNEALGEAAVKLFDSVVLGGTFDHFHVGHKLLLSTAAFVCAQSLLVGVTAASMLQRKTLLELVEPPNARHEAVRSFVQRVKPQVQLSVVEIDTPEGPTVAMPELQCIVVSEETVRGAQSINEQRAAKQLSPLAVVQLPLFALPPYPATSALSIDPSLQLDKLSSTAARFATLARYLGRSNSYPHVHNASSRLHSCYTVGLTGGIASGKSHIASVLKRCGAAVIDCDALGHECYRRGEPAYTAIVDEWGGKVVAKSGEIDRKVLGPLVFADAAQMSKLNAIVWPAIKQKIEERLSGYTAADVVVLEAAVLMEAGWSDDKALCDEVWVAFIQRDEAVRRVQQRNGVDAAEATRRVDAQLPNAQRIQRADVLLCSQWSHEQTERLCKAAWEALQKRAANRAESLAGQGVKERWEFVVRRVCHRKPPKKIKATINMIKNEEGVEEEPLNESKEEAEEEADDEDMPALEPEEKQATPTKKRGAKAEKVNGVNGKEEKQDDSEGKEAAPAASTVAESLIVKWWSMLPHSDELDGMRTLLFALWDQQRPRLRYPEELLLAIFFHHAAFSVKQEGGLLPKVEPGAALAPAASVKPDDSAARPQRVGRRGVKAEPVKAETQQAAAAASAEPARTDASTSMSSELVATTHSSALASCKLFASFASDASLPHASIDRLLNLLTMAAPPAVGVHLPARAAESVDEEVWMDLVRAMR